MATIVDDPTVQTSRIDVSLAARGRAGGARRSVMWLQGLAFLLGLALLIYVVHRVGVQPIFDALGHIGFGFFGVLAISGARHIFRSLAMRCAFAPEHRRFTAAHALAVRLGGEAISFLTFTGPLLGEATKVALLRRRVPLAQGVPALVVDNLLYNLSVVFFVLSGACVMLASYDLPLVVRYVLLTIAIISALGILAAAWAAGHRLTPLTWLVDRAAGLGWKRNLLLERRAEVYRLESEVYDFYRRRRGAFLAMLGFDFLSHGTSVFEVYFALHMLGFTAPANACYIIESLTKVINFVFGFVPGTIGVYEGGTELILRTLGFAVATGVTLALVRKAAVVFWTLVGVAILLGRAMPRAAQSVLDRYPRLEKFMDNLVLSNILHRPARTAVSVFGVAIGVLLIVFTVGLAHGLLRDRAQRESNIHAEIRVQASGTLGLTGPFALPTSRAAEIARIPGVRAAVPVGQNLDKTESGFGSRIIDGINFDEYVAITGMRLVEGSKLAGGDEAIVDSVWEKEHQAPIGSTIEVFERPFKIVGVYEPANGGRIKIPLSTMQDQLGSAGRCTMVLVACNDPSEQDAVAARIRERFPTDQIIFIRDLPELYSSGVPALNVFLRVVVGIAAAVSMLVILLAMYTTVTERTRQIGILKALGMSKMAIAWVFEQEALAVSVLGVIIGLVMTLVVRFVIMRSTSLVIEIELRWLLIALAVGLCGGTLGALIPALRAARQDAVEALSYE